MKKYFILLATALAALTLASCNKNGQDAPEARKGRTSITIKAQMPETKTHIVATEDAGGVFYTAHWDETGEALGLLLTQGAITASDAPVELPGAKVDGQMVFHGEGFDFADGTYNMMAYSPFECYQYSGDGFIVGELKGAQNPVKGSFDPKADLLGYSATGVVIADGSATIENVELVRPMAILRINLNAEEGDKAFGEVATDLRIDLPESINIAGRISIAQNGATEFVEGEHAVIAHLNPEDQIKIGAAGDAKAVYLVVAPVTIPKDTEITFTLSTENYNGETEITRTVTAPENMVLEGGNVNVIDLKIRDKDIVEMRYAGGTGIEGDPWLIATAQQMVHMNEDLVNGETKYFKLIDDIDMTGIEWVPANAVAVANKFDKGVNFDGDNHTISNLDCASAAYPSLFGVLYGTVKNLTIDGANIHGTGKAGVLGGYLSTQNYTANVSNVTIKNSTVIANNYAGALGGQVGAEGSVFSNCKIIDTNVESSTGDVGGLLGLVSLAATIEGCSVTGGTFKAKARYAGGLIGALSDAASTIKNCFTKDVTVISTSDRVGGLIGELPASAVVSNCYAENVSATGTVNIGGLIGVCYGKVSDCYSSGTLSSTNTTSNTDIGLGGLLGYVDKSPVISGCHSSVTINQTTNGRDIGGLIGKLITGTVEKCYATGSVSGMQRNVGGFVGLVTLTSGNVVIRNCYSTGSATGNAYTGGFIGYYEKGNLEITDCYASGVASGPAFAFGGFIGVATAAAFKVVNCAAWGSAVTASAIGTSNWSSAAFCGVTFPKGGTMTDCYRNPAMKVTAYWGTEEGYTYKLDADYSQPDLDASHPLTDHTGAEMTDTGTGGGNPHYPQFPYHGKVEAGKTLSQLASTTLGWSADVWDFSGALPTLK